MGNGSISFCGMSMDWNDVLADYEGKFSYVTVLVWKCSVCLQLFKASEDPPAPKYFPYATFLCYFLGKDGNMCSNYLCVSLFLSSLLYLSIRIFKGTTHFYLNILKQAWKN